MSFDLVLFYIILNPFVNTILLPLAILTVFFRQFEQIQKMSFLISNIADSDFNFTKNGIFLKQNKFRLIL